LSKRRGTALLPAGEAEAAIVQLDGLVWIKDTAPDLYAKITPAAAVLTEDMIGVCRRDSDYEDLNDIAQKGGETIAIAGGAESGSLLTFNVLAGFDEDFAAPDYRISGSWEQALSDVRGGIAVCAFGVMSTDAPVWRDLNDDFGDELRIVGFWDGDMRDLELAGRQVYGWRAQEKASRRFLWRSPSRQAAERPLRRKAQMTRTEDEARIVALISPA
jgi:hypothetical protein